MTVANKKATTSFLGEFLKEFFFDNEIMVFIKKAQNNIICTSS